jgi:hypothetical protein
VATDNERETRGWIDAMQSMESPRAGATPSNGGLGAPPEGSGLTPHLSGTRTKGFDGQAKPRGRASLQDSGDPSTVLREALLLFLPAADVAAVCLFATGCLHCRMCFWTHGPSYPVERLSRWCNCDREARNF